VVVVEYLAEVAEAEHRDHRAEGAVVELRGRRVEAEVVEEAVEVVVAHRVPKIVLPRRQHRCQSQERSCWFRRDWRCWLSGEKS
jgi:hypothetical protein